MVNFIVPLLNKMHTDPQNFFYDFYVSKRKLPYFSQASRNAQTIVMLITCDVWKEK